MLQKYPSTKVEMERMYDSQDDWFIVLFSRDMKSAEIVSVRYDRAELTNERETCSPTIAIKVDEERRVQAK